MLFLFVFWHPCNVNVGIFKVVLEFPYGILISLDSFFFFLAVLISCFFFLILKSLIWFCASFTLLLIPCKMFFISISVSVYDWIFFMRSSLSSLSILITSVLSSASDRFPLSILISSFSGVLNCFSLGPFFFVSSFWRPPCVYFYVLGRTTMTPCIGCMA